MIYQFRCTQCAEIFELSRRVADMDLPAFCSGCHQEGIRIPFPERVFFSGEKVEHPEFHPAFGSVIKNKKHLRDEARARGMEEIGTEAPDKIKKHDEKNLAEKLKRNWEKV